MWQAFASDGLCSTPGGILSYQYLQSISPFLFMQSNYHAVSRVDQYDVLQYIQMVLISSNYDSIKELRQLWVKI